LTIRFASQYGTLIARTRHDGTITLDFPAIASLTRHNGIRGIIVTAAATDPHSG
jgi:hypothetical protein